MRTARLPAVAAWLAAGVLGIAPARGAEPAGSFTIRADWLDRGNVQISTRGMAYADQHACIWNGGQVPNRSEYDLDFPVTADYTLLALYAAADSRPVDVYLDGAKVHRGLGCVTGSWQTSSARWEKQCTLRITAGRHTIKLLCPGPCMPHVCALRFESPLGFPASWKLARGGSRPRPARIEPVTPHAHRLLSMAMAGPPGEQGPLAVEVALREQAAAVGAAARDELLQDQPEGDLPATPWVARVSLRRPAGATETDLLELSPDRLRKMLDHAERLIDDYRTLDPGLGRRVGRSPTDPSAWISLLDTEGAEIARQRSALDSLLLEPEGRPKWERFARAYLATFRLEARLVRSNPLLDFDKLLVVRRSVSSPALGLPQNWQGNCALPTTGFDNEIAVLSPVEPGARLTTLYRPKTPVFVGDVDLHFDADRMLFSSIGTHGRWQVFEIRTDGTGLRQVTPADLPDVNHYDACYLPDGRILFGSTASMAAVPCVNGSSLVANLYRMEADGDPRSIRQLCFDQEHNWCPTVLESGRVLYLRWEYTDTPHSHDRVLFHMNPDGTGQMEFYGSNSYWPNAMFYARPIPGHATKFVAIVGGHHGVPRMGELVLFDAALGRREADGVIQRIPGHGRKVEPVIADNLVDNSWPKFLHPFPLGEKYFLVAAQQTPNSLWGIYLVDVFDGMFLLCEEPGYALLEPVPLRKTPRPPVLPDRTDPTRTDAVVYLADVYAGGGLAGVPRGAVKKLRLLSYHYLYPGMGGPQGVVGMEGPWDIKRILGTVPVEQDGSAAFRVPANTPISVQPLDSEGKALQLMRSWLTAMPGEVVSCVGCHEGQSSGPINKQTLAARRPPSAITPWYGPARGFNFAREVQPVLDRHCTGCHNGLADKQPVPPPIAFDLRGTEWIKDYTSLFHFGGVDAGHFTVAYAELHRFVRRPGLESDYHMLTPMEFHADTTRLVQMLRQGHYDVALDAESWDRLVTWIDLNAPFHGTWREIAGEARVKPLAQRRRELMKRYANVDVDPEAIWQSPGGTGCLPASAALGGWRLNEVKPQQGPDDTGASLRSAPATPGSAPATPSLPGWPMDAAEAKRRQAALGTTSRSIDLGGGLKMELVLIPPGEFVMGDAAGAGDERPACRVKIPKPFWMGRFEVTNAEFARFDPAHDSRVESKHAMQFGVRGFYVNGPRQPVVRIDWHQAMAFAAWLSARTGERLTLPTEAQWEYACRAGTATPFFYGDVGTDFSRHANLADRTLREFVCDPYNKVRSPFPNPGKYDDWIPKDERFTDGGFVSEEVGRWQPNAWGLHDVHGNVAEWTRSAYRPYPYRDDDGRNEAGGSEPRVVRGGSWRDKPHEARSASRLAYRSYQPVYNVGFRVVSEVQGDGSVASR